jgi:serine/threonine protein phosphatase PrpC
VFDGHGGKETAEFVSKQLHKTLLKELRRCFELTERSEPDQHPTIAKALQTAFLNTDNQLKEAKIDKSGSTAAVALLLKKPKDQHKMLYAANIGDSRTVLMYVTLSVIQTVNHSCSLTVQ